MLKKILFALAAGASLVQAVPFPASKVSQTASPFAELQARAGDPENCPGYAASNVVKTDSTLTADLTLAGDACNVYSEDIKDLKLVVEYQTNDRLHVKIVDSALTAYQVQEEILPRPKNENAAASGAALEFDIIEKPFSFTVKRKDNGEVLFDTTAGKLVFEKQYVRWRTALPKEPNIYGMGEHSDSFRFPTVYRRVIWNSESPNIPQNSNLYGTHPVYFDHRGDKGTHGVFLLNSNAMEVFMDTNPSGTQYLEYNTIGGVIDLYFLAGKQPAEVSKQYADVVGHSPMYPYWTFGFHQCRFGYYDVNMVAEVVGNYSTAGIPLEVMWTDIDYMNLRQDFTTDPDRFPIPKMQELISTLHERDQRYIVILDPGVHAVGNYSTYQKGHDMGVFLKGADGTDLLGDQWPGAVVWPDWFAPNTQQWWTDEIQEFFSKDTGLDLDGLWVDMNEASNFCSDQTCDARHEEIAQNLPPKPTHSPRPNTGRPIPGFPADFQPTTKGLQTRAAGDGNMLGYPDREWFHPNYRVNSHRGDLTQFTIFTNTSNYDGSRQYDTHNFYGHMMAHTTYNSMLSRRPGLRPFVLTRSTFAGSGRKVAHWFGDNESSWEHYRTTIRQMLAFVSMHQMPMVGSDVCGFNSNADQYMCARWALLGAFQPFYRNHAEISTVPQEFYQWPIVTTAAKKAIETRYKLLDYIYTALYHQTTSGTPMINPLFFIYPNDTNTFGLQNQWFYGDSLLISPVVEDYSDTVTFYLPDDIFYDYWTGEAVVGKGANVTLSNQSYTDIPVHIRGGSIIPQRVNSANTTKALREQPFSVIIAPDKNGEAKGRLYLDDGESIEQPGKSEIEFVYKAGKLSTSGTFAYAAVGAESVEVKHVVVLGSGALSTAGKDTVQGPWKLNESWEIDV